MRFATDNVDAVVLAGGVNSIPLFPGHAPGYKALLPFAGKPALRYVLEALQATPRVRRIGVVGPVPELRGMAGVPLLPPGETLLDSLLAALDLFRGSPVVLLVTADLPLLTPQAVSRFLEACGMIEAGEEQNLFWGMVPRCSFTGPFRRVRKGFNRFRNVAVCHGNLLLATPGLRHNPRLSRLNDLYRTRKSSVRAGLALGWGVGLSYLLGVHLLPLLTLEQMARVVSRRLGAAVIPVLLPHPEIAIDVDEPADYTFVRERLER